MLISEILFSGYYFHFRKETDKFLNQTTPSIEVVTTDFFLPAHAEIWDLCFDIL